MFGHKHKEDDSEQIENPELQEQLWSVFEKMPNDIDLLLFANPGVNDMFSQAARQVARMFRDLTSKISLREFSLDHKEAKKWKAEYSPTLLIDPEHYNIRWHGAPLGEEARTFWKPLLWLDMEMPI